MRKRRYTAAYWLYLISMIVLLAGSVVYCLYAVAQEGEDAEEVSAAVREIGKEGVFADYAMKGEEGWR